MTLLTRAWQRLRALVRRDTIEDEIDRELRLHVDLLAEEYERSGMPAAEARRAAVRRFGNPRRLIERGMDVRGAGLLDDLIADVKHTARGLARNRAFTVTVALTLALAIGAHAAVFSVVHSVLLQWPYPDADRLVHVRMTRGVVREAPPGAPEYGDWKHVSLAFDGIEARMLDGTALQPTDGSEEQPFSMMRATSGLLGLLGVRPALGRLLQEDDFRPDAAPVIVLAHETWIGRFGADRDVVGRAIHLGGTVHTIVGVAEPLRGSLLPQVEGIAPWLDGPQLRAAVPPPLLARLREGATVAQAQAEIDAIGWPSAPAAVAVVDGTVSRVRPTLLALLGATALILLIAVSNVANLLLARGSARQGELSVRAALGAGRARLARLLLTESLLLACLGGIAGVVLAYVAIHLLLAMEPLRIPRRTEIAIDGTALAVTAAVTVVCGVLAGLASMVVMLRSTTSGGSSALRRHPARDGRWVRSGLVVAQLALSLVLLAGSALTIRSYVALQGVPIGFDYRNIVSFALPGGSGLRMGPASPEISVQLHQYRTVLEHVRAVPDVLGATLTNQPPLSGDAGATRIELLSGTRYGDTPSVQLIAVTEDFFEFFGSRALSGRLFEPADAARADGLVVVDANLAQLLWPDESAVGQRLRFYDVESEVIGVSEPIRYGSLTQEMPPKLYHLLGRSGGGISGGTFLVRHDGRPGRILNAIEARVREADSTLALESAQPLAAIYDRYLREPRFYLLLLGALAGLALVVATVGVYGVVAYAVSRRVGEIGLRMALGAGWLQIVGLFCRRTVLLVAIGLCAGLMGASWLTRYIENLLFGVEPTDPVAFAATAALLAATAMTATLVPMRRALRVDPAVTLRAE